MVELFAGYVLSSVLGIVIFVLIAVKVLELIGSFISAILPFVLFFGLIWLGVKLSLKFWKKRQPGNS